MSENNPIAQDSEGGGSFPIIHLSEDVLLKILKNCSASDLVALSKTCKVFHRLTRDELLWKCICIRDFKLSQDDFVEVRSYYSLYTELLHKYGWMQGLYQSDIGPFGELMEVRFSCGKIEGINWGPTSLSDVDAVLKGYVLFSIKGDQTSSECICLPDIAPHSCSLSLDKEKNELSQKCSDPKIHTQALCEYFKSGQQVVEEGLYRLKMIFLDLALRQVLIHRPIILPEPNDIPEELLLQDGTCPPHLITPGLYKGTYGIHGTELIMFKYIDGNEIHGIKVTGDQNVYAQKISVKIQLKCVVNISEEQQSSFESLEEIDPNEYNASVSSIKDQPFIMPDDCDTEGNSPPNRCKARYHGLGHIAFEGYQEPSFIAAHVMVFSHDLIGVLWLDLRSFSLYRLVERTFSRNIRSDVESII